MGKEDVGASLAVQWLRFCASSLWGVGSIPHQGLNEDPICCMAKKKKKDVVYMNTVEYYSDIKSMKFCHFQQHEWTWGILCYVK